MHALLFVTAHLEIGAGVALLIAPVDSVGLLVGVELESPVLSAAARVAGAALLALGTACWPARRDLASRTAAGLVAGMLRYNVAVIAILVYANFGDGLSGVLMWPVVLLHTAMAIWCAVCLRFKQTAK